MLRPHGIIIVVGPTGSGKTTTLYSVLSKLNTTRVNIMTLEDPIEYRLKGINQSQIDPKKDYSFAKGLRSILRQDPDIVMVGEIRDNETAAISIQASLTGHLVVSSLHTNDSPSAITRLIDMNIEPYMISSTIVGIVGQRLVRTLCKNCKLPDDETSRDTLDEIVKPWKINGDYRPFKAVGCVECRMTGFKGRMGLYELMTIGEAFKDKVTQQPSLEALRRQAVVDGMRPLRLAGALRVAEGVTTLEEVLSATPPLS